MARGFSRRGRGAGLRFAARLDEGERALLIELFNQVRDLIDSTHLEAAQSDTSSTQPVSEDPIDAIDAGLGADFGSVTVPDSSAELGGRGFGSEDRDPALDRLFPAANRTDEDAAREFRRLTEDSLRARKLSGLTASIAALSEVVDDRVELSEQKAITFLVALTDVRLVLGDRLGLREDADAERLQAIAEAVDPQEPAAYAIVVYDFQTWLQETLATSMLPRH